MRASNKGIVGKSSLWEQTAGTTKHFIDTHPYKEEDKQKSLFYKAAYRYTSLERGRINRTK